MVSIIIVLIEPGADNTCEGDADGLGGTRKKELMKSGLLLGLRKEEDVFVVESPYVHFYSVEAAMASYFANLVPPENFPTV